MTVKKVEDPDTGVFKVECHSNHFTAFAVLMDVTGALNVSTFMHAYIMEQNTSYNSIIYF